MMRWLRQYNSPTHFVLVELLGRWRHQHPKAQARMKEESEELNMRIYEGSTEQTWIYRIQVKIFNTKGRWSFYCSQCEKRTSLDTGLYYYEIKIPHGLEDQKVWKPFCSYNCATKWVEEWFPREAEERKLAREEQEKYSRVSEEDIENYINEVITTWEYNAYRTRTYTDFIFSDQLSPNDLAILVWLAGRWLYQENATFTVDWEECLHSIGLSEEEKAESLETLTTKGWVELMVEGTLTLHIPRKMYWTRYGKPDREIIKRILARGGPKPLNLLVHAVAYFCPGA